MMLFLPAPLFGKPRTYLTKACTLDWLRGFYIERDSEEPQYREAPRTGNQKWQGKPKPGVLCGSHLQGS